MVMMTMNWVRTNIFWMSLNKTWIVGIELTIMKVKRIKVKRMKVMRIWILMKQICCIR